jgi:hypothetical protein
MEAYNMRKYTIRKDNYEPNLTYNWLYKIYDRIEALIGEHIFEIVEDKDERPNIFIGVGNDIATKKYSACSLFSVNVGYKRTEYADLCIIVDENDFDFPKNINDALVDRIATCIIARLFEESPELSGHNLMKKIIDYLFKKYGFGVIEKTEDNLAVYLKSHSDFQPEPSSYSNTYMYLLDWWKFMDETGEY